MLNNDSSNKLNMIVIRLTFVRTRTSDLSIMRTHKKKRCVGPPRKKKKKREDKKRREIFQADRRRGQSGQLRTCVTTMVELEKKKFVEKGGGRWQTNTSRRQESDNAFRNVTCTSSDSAGVFCNLIYYPHNPERKRDGNR